MTLYEKEHHSRHYINDATEFYYSDENLRDSLRPHLVTRAILVPHAGLSISGKIAKMAYDRIDWNRIDEVIILSTHHKSVKHPGNIVPKSNRFELNEHISFPLIDLNLNIDKNDEAFNREHSWLTQMPFIKPSLPTAIILISEYDENLAEQISHRIGNNTLLIANTDLLHCGKNYNVECPHDIEQITEILLKVSP